MGPEGVSIQYPATQRQHVLRLVVLRRLVVRQHLHVLQPQRPLRGHRGRRGQVAHGVLRQRLGGNEDQTRRLILILPFPSFTTSSRIIKLTSSLSVTVEVRFLSFPSSLSLCVRACARCVRVSAGVLYYCCFFYVLLLGFFGRFTLALSLY